MSQLEALELTRKNLDRILGAVTMVLEIAEPLGEVSKDSGEGLVWEAQEGRHERLLGTLRE